MHALRHHHHHQQARRGSMNAPPATPSLFRPRLLGAAGTMTPRLRATGPDEWQPVVDPATGRTYYWNTATNATQWEPPVAPAAAPAPPAPSTAAAAPTTTTTVPERGSFGAAASTAGNEDAPSREQLLADLISAMNADGSGMAFWEAARERRKYGVFEDSYIDWLTTKVEGGGEGGEVAERVRARLVNPLLRQPAPFEL